MKRQTAITKNVAALIQASENLSTRDIGVPGMGLVYGATGAGKTTAVAYTVNLTDGVYVRATATWTPSAMLGSLMQELGAAPVGNNSSSMMGWIAEQLTASGRPLFVDEADYLMHNARMVESLRDLHDISGVPVVLIGMEGIDKRIAARKQLAGRISHWVEFLPADIGDARILADAICEVIVDDDLLQDLHAQAKGSMRLMTVGLSRIEAAAKGQRLTEMDSAAWKSRPFFLAGAARRG